MMRRTLLCARRGCGIVGLPNVGKSTLFNAMTASSQAKTGNYPFCTIDANLAKVSVFDPRLRELAKFSSAQQLIDVEIDLADVAGLIEGAHKGEGMGNKFLADIRPRTVILNMVRCFEDAREGFEPPEPLADIATIANELIFADLDVVDKRFSKLKKAKGTKDPEVVVLQKVLNVLEDGKSAREVVPQDRHQRQIINDLGLLSTKPILYVLNVDDSSVAIGNKYSQVVEEKFGVENTVRVCSVIEEQTAQFDREERLSFLEEYGVKEPSVEVLLRKMFDMLQLQAFFTVGPKMAKAWSIPKGTSAIDAAGEIHTDFKKHFWQARVSDWKDFAGQDTFEKAEKGMKIVEDDYIMKDGEVFVVEHRANK